MAECITADTFVYAYIDGSLDISSKWDDLTAALEGLKATLASEVYGELADERFFIEILPTEGIDSERWLEVATRPTEERVVVIAIINEAVPRYHSLPRNAAIEPTTYFEDDQAAWVTLTQTKAFRRLLLYALDVPGTGYEAFEPHVLAAFAGTDGYTPLDPEFASARLGVSGSEGAAFYEADLEAYLSEVCLGASAVLVQDPKDRLRSKFSADSGSILAASKAIPADASHEIAFNPTQILSQAALYPFREATRQQSFGPIDLVFYPRATQNGENARTYSGVTFLSLMDRTYTSRVVARYDDTSVGLASGRAELWIEWFFERWASEHSWFDYEPVPDLRVPLPGPSGILRPSEYSTSPDTDRPRLFGLAVSDVVVFPQARENQRSMLEILLELLSPFPGVVYFVNSSGKLQLVPAYGPDADDLLGTPFRELEGVFVRDESVGEPDAQTIFNRSTVASRGYGITADVATMQPAWFQVGGNGQLGRTNWYEPPGDRRNLQETEDGAILQEGLASGAFGEQFPVFWPISEDAVPAGDGIGLGTVGSPTISVGWARYSNDVLDETGTSDFTLVSEIIPFSGEWVTVGTFSKVSALDFYAFTLRGRWNSTRQGVELTLASGAKFEAFCAAAPCSVLIIEFTLADATVAYDETTGVTVTYGIVGETEPLGIGEDGADVVAASQAEYGIREDRVNIVGYVLNASQAMGLAMGRVLANITPRATRTIDLGVLGSTQALFDHLGRSFRLPDGSVGRLVGISYGDGFVSPNLSKTLRVEVEIPGAPGAIDSTADWLLNDDGSFWQNEDGTTSEVA